MSTKKSIETINQGDSRVLIATTNYTVLPAGKIITWKKQVYTQEDIKNKKHRQMWLLQDNGQAIGQGASVEYKFSKEDCGKFLKFYAMINAFQRVDQSIIFYTEPQNDTNVRIKAVRTGPSEATIGKTVEYSVEYNMPDNKVLSKVKENVKWMVRIDGKDERLIIDDIPLSGEKISFAVPDEWNGKEVIVNAFFEYSYAEGECKYKMYYGYNAL